MPEFDFSRLADIALERCDELAALSEMPDGILRQYLTPEHRRANEQVAQWAAESNLQHWQDEVGNQWLRYPSDMPNAKRLILGSHLDTVPNAGRYDGILGVLLGLAVQEMLVSKQTPLPFHVDVVGFCDEEGTRFGTTLIGSQAIAGQFDAAWLDLEDSKGITLREAMLEFGLDPNKFAQVALNPDDILSYLEVHIEQGPVLESLEESLGVVTGIAGAKRANITVQGQAGHAGTTPMNLRNDALAAASEFILSVESLAGACDDGEVATVGQCYAMPGATNVIPGTVQLSLDVRALKDEHRDALLEKILQQAKQIEQRRNAFFAVEWTHEASSVQSAEHLLNHIQNQAQQVFHKVLPMLPSGAGHDAMAVANLCPMAMIFIRSPRGLSHHPDESVQHHDVTHALLLFYRVIISLQAG